MYLYQEKQYVVQRFVQTELKYKSLSVLKRHTDIDLGTFYLISFKEL